MISNPDLILYACIAKGSTILAEFASPTAEPGIEEIAHKCIGIAPPPHHTTFSQTAKKKTYTFLIDDPFVYFAVYHHDLAKLESSWFIDRVKISFLELIASNSVRDLENLTSLCFQAEFSPQFREILALDLDLGMDSLTETTSKDSRNPSMDSTKEKTVPLLKKKKKRSSGVCSIGGMEDKSSSGGGHRRGKDGSGLSCGGMSDHGGKMMMNGGGGVLMGENRSVDGGGRNHAREFSVAMSPKSGGLYMLESRQKAKQMWRKHVWVVLTLDLVICAVLFFVWLWVCRGFTCIDG
ncbi:unnamed protein product [Linum tenue]|uniref:Longin domain-containing protein n=1 Tax=Linum tenue TaxID=586396 RepID=A0AAV0IIM7_9ROSI|nr:unnamed protein product [Linum tenue]